MKLDTDKMIAQKDGAIGWMTFNNPERRNAITYEMRLAILSILDDFETDPAIRVIVLKGAGDKAFVSGSDISQFDSLRATPEQQAEYDRVSLAAMQRYGTVTKPTISMIRGFCLGGGLQTALATDIRIAADDAQFGIPAGRLGIAYGWDNVRKLMDIVGPAHAKEILYTAKRYSAAQALHMGLVTQVVPVAQLETAVRETAGAIAENAPLSVLAAKRAIDELVKDPADRDEDGARAIQKRAMESEDFKEGRRAFMEKRRPVWQGR